MTALEHAISQLAGRITVPRRQAALILGVSLRSLDKLRQSPDFPQPIERIGRCVGFEWAELIAYREARKGQRASKGAM